jgi:hypothetical protein
MKCAYIAEHVRRLINRCARALSEGNNATVPQSAGMPLASHKSPPTPQRSVLLRATVALVSYNAAANPTHRHPMTSPPTPGAKPSRRFLGWDAALALGPRPDRHHCRGRLLADVPPRRCQPPPFPPHDTPVATDTPPPTETPVRPIPAPKRRPSRPTRLRLPSNSAPPVVPIIRPPRSRPSDCPCADDTLTAMISPPSTPNPVTCAA